MTSQWPNSGLDDAPEFYLSPSHPSKDCLSEPHATLPPDLTARGGRVPREEFPCVCRDWELLGQE